MDRTTVEDPREALWRATDDLHQKTLENYRRWVKYVNLQEGNVRGGSVDDSDLGSEHWISLSALSGNAWEFFGMCGFTSDMNESSWVCNAQLHHLLLWYLIWGEASNLRFTPELLCFLFYCMSNALMLSTQSDSEVRNLKAERQHVYREKQAHSTTGCDIGGRDELPGYLPGERLFELDRHAYLQTT